MIQHSIPTKICVPLWNSIPIGASFCLRLCQDEQLSPQLILEDKVVRSAVRLHNNTQCLFQTQLIGTLISDDESKRLTYVIDRLLLKESIVNDVNTHQPLAGEFLIPIQWNNKELSSIKTFRQNGVKDIENYCNSLLRLDVHRFSYLCGHISSVNSTCINIHLTFNLLTIKTTFSLTPINSDCIQILPTALYKQIRSSIDNNIYTNQTNFGYCGLDSTSNNKILLMLENDPQISSLPLVGIWISNIVNIKSAFVWAACIRYYMNSSLKQRLRSGVNSQQSFLLACYSSTLHNQWTFYEVYSIPILSKPSLIVDYDLWTCSKNIVIPSSSLNQHDSTNSTQIPYDFEFKRIDDLEKPYLNSSIQYRNDKSMNKTQYPQHMSCSSEERYRNSHEDYNKYHHTALPTSNANGSLFGFPREPPQQSTVPLPSWDSLFNTTIITPKKNVRPSTATPKSKQVSSLVKSTSADDIQWKQELMDKMQSYDNHIQSLTAVITQLLAIQKQQQSSLTTTPIKQSIKRDVAVQSEPVSLESSLSSSNIDHGQQRSSYNTSPEKKQNAKFQPLRPLSSSITHEHEPVIHCSPFRKSTTPIRSKSPSLSVVSKDLNPVDILKPIFQFIDNQQQKQQRRPATSLVTTYNSTDKGLFTLNNRETDNQNEDIHQLSNATQPQQQQQQVTSTMTTGISFISNGVQMQFINQRSSTTTLYSQSQSVHTSPQKSENNLSIEVHGLEMKYLEDDQLAVTIECDRQTPKSLNRLSEPSQIVDKSLSFETKEYLQRYDLFTDSNR